MIKSDGVRELHRNRGIIVYDIPTLKGQGGAPIISVVGTKLKIIGIVKGSIKEEKNGTIASKNMGRLLTKGLLEQLEGETKKLGAEMFTI